MSVILIDHDGRRVGFTSAEESLDWLGGIELRLFCCCKSVTRLATVGARLRQRLCWRAAYLWVWSGGRPLAFTCLLSWDGAGSIAVTRAGAESFLFTQHFHFSGQRCDNGLCGAACRQALAFEEDRASWPAYHDWCLEHDWTERARALARALQERKGP